MNSHRVPLTYSLSSYYALSTRDTKFFTLEFLCSRVPSLWTRDRDIDMVHHQRDRKHSRSLNGKVKCHPFREKFGCCRLGSITEASGRCGSEWALRVGRPRQGDEKEEGTVGEGHSQGDEMV